MTAVTWMVKKVKNLCKLWLSQRKENMLTYTNSLEKVKQGAWANFFKKQSIEGLMEKLDKESSTIYPSPENIFKVFELSPQDIKVVILGQDPYYNPGQANGLAFSVNPQVSAPRSLKNIFQELKEDLGIERKNPDLSDWHKQGVFLLNTALSVPEKEPNKHKKDWEGFTKDLLTYLTQQNPTILYVMWGKNAEEHGRRLEKCLPQDRELIHYSGHPSPLSARKGFFGSKPFSWVNKNLKEQGKKEINW